MALDGNGRYCALCPREGAKLIVAECCRNLSTWARWRWRLRKFEFRKSGAAGNHGATGGDHRRDWRGLPVFDTPITGGNVSPV